jgi:hypothetical protein
MPKAKPKYCPPPTNRVGRFFDEMTKAAHKRRKLPPDLEEQNGERSNWAKTALVAFHLETGTDFGDVVCDLLCDLQHFCDRHGINFAHELDRANVHYADEIIEGLEPK